MSADDLLTKEQVAAFHAKVDAYLREADRDVPLFQRAWVLWANVAVALVAVVVAVATRHAPGTTTPLAVAAVLVGGGTLAARLPRAGHRWARPVAVAGVAVAVAVGGIGAVASIQRTGPAAPRPLLAPAQVASDGCYMRPTGRVDCSL
jgi:peptidoglycan/LPS O-acetylase OafA/YrhL